MTYLIDLAAAVRKSGLRVVELPGWRTRGRPASSGGFNPRGVLCHHTGGTADSRAYVEWMAYTGRSDLPAPLCQLALGRDGTVYVCAAGRANHAGDAKASGPMPGGDGNALYIGVEAMNTGGEGWTDTQRDAYARLCAALCDHYGWPASHVRAHRETSLTGKWDPGLLDMDDHRRRVARLLRNPNHQEDYMATPEAKAQLEQLQASVDRLTQMVRVQRGNTYERDRAIIALVRAVLRGQADDATKTDLAAEADRLEAAIENQE